MPVPDRKPDFMQATGSKFWFEEMMYESNAGIRKMVLNSKGLLGIGEGKKKTFRADVQKAYKDWMTNTAETIMLDESDDELQSKT